MLSPLAHVVFAFDDSGIYIWIAISILILGICLRFLVDDRENFRWWKSPVLLVAMLVPITGGIFYHEPHHEQSTVVYWQGVTIWGAAALTSAWYMLSWLFRVHGWRRITLSFLVPIVIFTSYIMAYRIKDWIIHGLA